MAQELKTTGGDAGRSDAARSDGHGAGGPVYRPATDIFEKDDVVTLAIDMPGVDPASVDISVENRALTVRGEIQAPAPEGYRRIHAEYAPGTFERAFSLPDTIDAGGIDASHKDGVLTLTLRKNAAARPKQIKVKAA